MYGGIKTAIAVSSVTNRAARIFSPFIFPLGDSPKNLLFPSKCSRATIGLFHSALDILQVQIRRAVLGFWAWEGAQDMSEQGFQNIALSNFRSEKKPIPETYSTRNYESSEYCRSWVMKPKVLFFYTKVGSHIHILYLLSWETNMGVYSWFHHVDMLYVRNRERNIWKWLGSNHLTSN